jgi:hypothetical protein
MNEYKELEKGYLWRNLRLQWTYTISFSLWCSNLFLFSLSAHAQRSSSSSHIRKHCQFGSTHAGQASVNLMRCNHKFATTHLCDKTEVSDAEINWKSKQQQSRSSSEVTSKHARAIIYSIWTPKITFSIPKNLHFFCQSTSKGNIFASISLYDIKNSRSSKLVLLS